MGKVYDLSDMEIKNRSKRKKRLAGLKVPEISKPAEVLPEEIGENISGIMIPELPEFPSDLGSLTSLLPALSTDFASFENLLSSAEKRILPLLGEVTNALPDTFVNQTKLDKQTFEIFLFRSIDPTSLFLWEKWKATKNGE